ncbi:MAG: sugar kinase [Lachnospiraceae bacterium]|nr:sugar kinase [Lachnospiraceae bacterium]
MAKIVTLGELLLRLSPAGNARFFQANAFDVNYGGAEANVAASLAQLGHDVSFVSKVPANAIGDAAIGTLRKCGVNCRHIARGGERLGIYFLENGASVRPSSVVYDRKHSSITQALPEEFDFDTIFQGADLFHVSGITPVLSKEAAALTIEALKQARAHGVLVSFDLNYRAKLWTENIPQKQKMLCDMMQYVDICFGNARDAAKCLGYSEPGTDFLDGDYKICVDETHMKHVLEKYDFKYLITTLRGSISASDNNWSAAVCSREKLYHGHEYHLHIVDRVGGGDSFASGFLHGIVSEMGMEKSLEFAIAAAAIKHTIPGDINYLNEAEVLTLMNSDGSGRVQR